MVADYLNILFILISGLIAYFMPFELLVFSYAFLGPAHYLTQISWMHKRDYFLKKKWDMLPLVALVTLIVSLPHYYDDLMAVTLITAVVLFSVRNNLWRFALIILFSVATIAYQRWSGPILFLFFLPTIIHVFVFTFLFILHGALERKSIPSFASLVLMVLMGGSFFIFREIEAAYTLKDFYEGKVSFLRQEIEMVLSLLGTINSWEYLVAICRFLAFAYTFHYLNWFSKTETIGWHRIPKRNLVFLLGLYLILISIYLYDFLTGVKLLVWLSFLHVVLELPLNTRILKNLFAAQLLRTRQ